MLATKQTLWNKIQKSACYVFLNFGDEFYYLANCIHENTCKKIAKYIWHGAKICYLTWYVIELCNEENSPSWQFKLYITTICSVFNKAWWCESVDLSFCIFASLDSITIKYYYSSLQYFLGFCFSSSFASWMRKQIFLY